MWEMGSKKLEMRILNAHIPFPISKFMAFEEKNWIGPREVGNENQTRILITEVPPSGNWPSAFHVDSPTPNWTSTIEQNNWAKNWLNKSQLIKKLTEHRSNDQTNNPTKINWSKSYWAMSQLIKFLAEQIAIEQLINWHLFSCQEGT